MKYKTNESYSFVMVRSTPVKFSTTVCKNSHTKMQTNKLHNLHFIYLMCFLCKYGQKTRGIRQMCVDNLLRVITQQVQATQ